MLTPGFRDKMGASAPFLIICIGYNCACSIAGLNSFYWYERKMHSDIAHEDRIDAILILRKVRYKTTRHKLALCKFYFHV